MLKTVYADFVWVGLLPSVVIAEYTGFWGLILPGSGRINPAADAFYPGDGESHGYR